VDDLFTALVQQRWDDARTRMAEEFRYRRLRQLDSQGFLEMWKGRAGFRWGRHSVRQFGSEVILEVMASEPRPAAVLWICRVTGETVESLVEYQDTGT
jgi:hypothetical protein